MKRVLRDVIKIVTTVRRLSEEHSQIHLDPGYATAEMQMTSPIDDEISTRTSESQADPLSESVYTTYLLIYHVVDD